MGASRHVLGCKVVALSPAADSSADYMQGTRMHFNTKEDAIAFAEKQGMLFVNRAWTYTRLGILYPRTS